MRMRFRDAPVLALCNKPNNSGMCPRYSIHESDWMLLATLL